jgi:hypothetical protein
MVNAVLLQGTVVESEKRAYCIMGTPDGAQGIVPIPLSDQEMDAYRQSPQMFFGREERKRRAENPLELYDFMLAGYKDTPTDKLLDLLAHTGVSSSEVAAMSQPKLAELLAERYTESIVWNSGRGAKTNDVGPTEV